MTTVGLFQVWQTRTVDSCLIIIGCAGGSVRSTIDPLPIGSMYGIYANIGGILMVNVTIYIIHGSYGLVIEDDVPENPSLVIDDFPSKLPRILFGILKISEATKMTRACHMNILFL